MQVSIPFLRTEFPELDHLATEERQRILEGCVNSAELQRFSRQHTRTVRLSFVIIPIGIIVTLFRERIGLPIIVVPWMIWMVLGVMLISFATSFIVFHLRSSKFVKECVAHQLSQRT